VEADEDTDIEVGGDVGTGPGAVSAAKPRRKTRAAVAKQSVTTTAATVTAVKAAEKKRKRKTSPPPEVGTPVIPTPQSKEVESDEEEDEVVEEPPVVEDQSARRSLSPTAKRQRELAKKTMEDALREGLEAQRAAAAAAQAKMPVLNRSRFFRPKPYVPTITR
jgi:hypothetical protein